MGEGTVKMHPGVQNIPKLTGDIKRKDKEMMRSCQP